MITSSSGFEDGGEVGGLRVGQRDGAADLDQSAVAVPSGDHHLGPLDRTEDTHPQTGQSAHPASPSSIAWQHPVTDR